MTTTGVHELVVERHIAATPARIWQMWTDRLEEWWCPKPWQTRLIALDLTPGGRFSTVMSGPNGEVSPHDGIILEATPHRRIVFTDAFAPGWIPHKPFMVGIFEFTDDGTGGTHYRAAARHWDEESCQRHAEMGFHDGWSAVAAQLADLAEGPA